MSKVAADARNRIQQARQRDKPGQLRAAHRSAAAGGDWRILAVMLVGSLMAVLDKTMSVMQNRLRVQAQKARAR